MRFSLFFQKIVHGSWISDKRGTAAAGQPLCACKNCVTFNSPFALSVSGETSDSAQFARIEVQEPKLAATVRYFHVKQSGGALASAPPSPTVQVYYVSISSIRTSAAKERSERCEQLPHRERCTLIWEIVVFGILAKYHFPLPHSLLFLHSSQIWETNGESHNM